MAKPIFDRPNALVIGGAGFIGSHLCDELVKTHKVICIDNFVSSSHQNIEHLTGNPNFIFIRHDATAPFKLEQWPELARFKIEFQGVQEVYNLATPTSQKNFEKLLLETAYANSLLVKNALDVAFLSQAKYLQVSSHAVYGDLLEDQPAFVEDYWGFVNPVGPRSAYNEGKRFAEGLVMNYHRQAKLDTRIARVFNTYGPRMALDTGRMIPDFVKNGSQGTNIVIFGDGKNQDTFMYVADLIDGLIKLMESNHNEPINFGNPEQSTILEVAEVIQQLTGSKSNIEFSDPLPGLIIPGPADISRAQKALNWFPVTKLEEGLAKTVEDMLGRGMASPKAI